MRIGVFGGSFDPVHLGHLIAAECCREQLRLDRVIFMPASIPPHKQDRQLAAARHRLEMLTLATSGHEAFTVSSDELDRGGVSYTIDTLTTLTARHAGDRLCLLLGPDAALALPTWREPRRIVDLAEVAVMERESLDDVAAPVARRALEPLLGREGLERLLADRVRLPAIGIRASDIRAALAAGRSIRYRTPRAVEQYIASHGLYGGG